VKPFRRTGSHRLECPACPFYVYATVAALEAHGLPACPCGQPLEPTRAELAALLGLESSDAMRELAREVERIARGQARRTGYGHARDASTLVMVGAETKALERVEGWRRAAARKRQLGALKPAPEAMPF
jgi:hypothetical protein